MLQSPITSESSKRKRLSISLESDMMEDDFTSNYKDFSKILISVDELKLKNERLADQLKQTKLGFDREKDKFLRQLEFLDAENTQLRKSYSDKSELYFEEKKKWKEKQRSLESERDKALKKASQVQPTPLVASSAAPKNSESDSILPKLYKLEESIKLKSHEVQSLSLKNSVRKHYIL